MQLYIIAGAVSWTSPTVSGRFFATVSGRSFASPLADTMPRLAAAGLFVAALLRGAAADTW